MSLRSITIDGQPVNDRDWNDALASACRIDGHDATKPHCHRFANDNACGLARMPNRADARLLSFLADPREGEAQS